MADKPASEKTEQPTADRLRKARSKGQVAQSQELPSALMFVALLIVTTFMAPDLWQWFTVQVQEGLSLHRTGPLTEDTFLHLLRDKAAQTMWIMAPFLAATSIASVLGSVLVGGVTMSPEAIKWDLAKLAPSAGLKQVISPQSVMHLVTSLIKLAALVAITVAYLKDKMGLCLALTAATPLAALATSFELIFGLVARITILLAAIALGDVIYQKWQYKRQLRMTRQEVKEERKSHEGSPQVKNRIRSIHFTIMRKRMLRDVPKADVVIVNPTHVAVALKYDAAAMAAPSVLAKGADLMCERIKEIAREHGVPVIERPELARSLYASAEVGQAIPEALYVAVAEVLAMIFRLKRQG